jgi:hypothetical protein
MRKIVVATGALLAAPFVTHAAGETGMAFLKVGVGTDAVGVGHAYTSQVSDATATYWNPAGLPRIGGTDLCFVHNEFIADLRTEYAGVARSFGRHGLGLSFNGLFTEALEGRDENGEITGSIGYHDIAFTIGYGFSFSDALTAGVGVKYLREFIGDPGASDDHVASGIATDLGAQYHTGRFAFGAALQNLGSDLTFNEVQIITQSGPGEMIGGESLSLPVTLQGGVTMRPAWNVMNGGVELAVEGRQVRGEDFGVLLGARYRYQNVASLSVGYRTGLDTEDLTFGLRFDQERFRAGYAFVPFSDDLGNSHRISIGYRVP